MKFGMYIVHCTLYSTVRIIMFYVIFQENYVINIFIFSLSRLFNQGYVSRDFVPLSSVNLMDQITQNILHLICIFYIITIPNQIIGTRIWLCKLNLH